MSGSQAISRAAAAAAAAEKCCARVKGKGSGKISIGSFLFLGSYWEARGWLADWKEPCWNFSVVFGVFGVFVVCRGEGRGEGGDVTWTLARIFD